MKKTTFIEAENAVWLKGNLHTHTTNSDGELSAEVVAAMYKDRGYDFISLTDHDIFTQYPQLCDGKIMLIPGFELTATLASGSRTHLNIIQKGETCDFLQNQRFSLNTANELADFIQAHKQNYLIILNHPYWSLLEWEEVIDLDVAYMEVYNHGSEWLDCVGEASKFWDTMLRKGKKIWGIATDDSHNGYKHIDGWPLELIQTDSFGGWICVKCREKSVKSVTKAIESGSFYSSTGPEIKDFYVEDGVVSVKCSPCERIIFSGDRRYFQRRFGNNLTGFTTPLKGNEKFIRVQCVDKNGKTAYSNPIYL